MHSKAVGEKAATLATRLAVPDGDVLVAAAYLHDIGYAPVLAIEGFHPLDGGVYLRNVGQDRLATLVAHHGGAAEEALVRDLSDALRQFRREDSDIARILDYCDLTVGPNGEDMTPQERLADVESRYGPDHVVTRSLRSAWPRLEEELTAVGRMLSASAQPSRAGSGVA
ncbi:MAG: HD domain-containing protein [Actinomycetota bacterium]|nr:HD domain-containing protein [Actinomycetota bacterium]